MTDQRDEVIDGVNTLIHDCECLLSIARNSNLQRQAVINLEHLFHRLAALKGEAVAAQDENRANLFLGFECVVGSLQSELMMWLFLKLEEPEKAWDCLIQAQDAAGASARAHPGFSHNEHHVARLEAIEQLVFPPQSFVSAGLMVGREVCTICLEDYEDCPHVACRPYWGEFCAIRQEDIRADHVSLVEHPSDKRCRIVSFDDKGVRRNKMTWKVEGASSRETLSEGNEFSVRILSAGGSRIDPREALVSRTDQATKTRRRSKSPRRPKEQGTGGASHSAKDRRTGPTNRNGSA